jgi:hypothetical protein
VSVVEHERCKYVVALLRRSVENIVTQKNCAVKIRDKRVFFALICCGRPKFVTKSKTKKCSFSFLKFEV